MAEVNRAQLGRAFSLTVRRLREDMDLAQEALAGKADIDRGYMGALERGKHVPTLETIYKLLPALKLTFPRFSVKFDQTLRDVKKLNSRARKK